MDVQRPSALAQLLGFEIIEQGPGLASLRATVGPAHVNGHGTAHGGFLFALADEALAIASNSHGPVAVALVASIHFTRRTEEGAVLLAEAREVSLGWSAAVYEIKVSSESRTVALFTGTVHRQTGSVAPTGPPRTR